MSRQARKRYSAQFKADAVRLVEEEGYSVAEVSQRLDVDRSCVARWRREQRHGDSPPAEAAPAVGQDQEAEVRRLREEVRRLRMERDILKNPPMARALPSGEKLALGEQVPMALAYAR